MEYSDIRRHGDYLTHIASLKEMLAKADVEMEQVLRFFFLADVFFQTIVVLFCFVF